jgi:SecY interacting protein Syd
MDPPAAFEGIPLHPDLREFYGSFWGGSAYGRHSGESVGVSVAWNPDNLARITQFIRAQVLTGESVFVANTDSDWYFGADNATGAVWLCEPGRPPIRQVAPSLAAFLAEVR